MSGDVAVDKSYNRFWQPIDSGDPTTTHRECCTGYPHPERLIGASWDIVEPMILWLSQGRPSGTPSCQTGKLLWKAKRVTSG